MTKTYTEDAKVTDDCNVYFDTIPASTKFKIYLDSGREYRGNFLTFFVDETEKDVPNRVDAVGLIEDLQDQFKINILKVNSNESSSKNILFEVVDDNLLKLTGGIVQGMSGSPIIQDGLIIGAVTHVIVDDPTKGYGTFITKMLEEAEN